MFSICALVVAMPGVSFATSDGTTVTSKLYVDAKLDLKQDKLPYNATNKVIITPTTDGGAAGTRDITTAGSNITGLANSSASGATNIPTAYAVKEALDSATNGMITDVTGKEDKSNKLDGTSGHTIGGLVAGSSAGQDQVMYPSAAAVKEYAVQKNAAITGATKTKITYDAKGLVTGGADLVASDIPDISATYETKSNKVQTIDTSSLTKADNYPSQAAVENYVAGQPGATAYTGTGLISVSDHTISTTAEENVQSDWDQATTTADDYIKNKPTITNTASDITGAAATDTKEIPTTYAVQQYAATLPGATAYTGTGLISVNDHTISTTAEANVLEGVQVAGTDQTITNKKVNLGAAAGKGVATTVSSSSTDSDVATAKAVYDQLVNKQTKPSSGVANGKVLTYTGNDANANVSAAYVTVPVATAAPSTVTPTGFAEIWVQ
ncbi:MAG: hypothetical protein J5742_03970 [Alphaproteobacteria bacterium]|nr:hypothetical protein [Alphaproteobacteria bacterium]